MQLIDLSLLGCLTLCGLFLWLHFNIRHRALAAALRHTERHRVLLLDQTIVLKSMKFRSSHRALFTFERVFEFEFCSLGDTRYKGRVKFAGQKQIGIWLEPFKTDFEDTPLDPS